GSERWDENAKSLEGNLRRRGSYELSVAFSPDALNGVEAENIGASRDLDQVKGQENFSEREVTMNAVIPPVLLTDEEREKLSAMLGVPKGDLVINESEFLAQTGCPPEKLETWLETSWTQYDIRAVLAGTEKVGPQPWLLANERDQTVRLFSPSSEAIRADAQV